MSLPTVSVVALNTCETTGEGPVWEEATKSIVYVDIMAGYVHKHNTVTGENHNIHLGGNVTFIVPRSKGGYLVSQGRNIATLDWDTHSLTKIAEVEPGTKNRINDAKCDASGRLWFGTMGDEPTPAVVEPGQGCLYSLDGSHVVKSHRQKLDLSNGLAWTADNRTMFFVDSIPRKVYAYDFDLASGEISNERTVLGFAEGTMKEYGYPDGMCIDLEDKIWLACYSAYKVIRFDPETGSILQTVNLPAAAITSCCFGGTDYNELYVTSGRRNVAKDVADKESAGSLFKISNLGTRGSSSVPFCG
jgi:gluconolactonase